MPTRGAIRSGGTCATPAQRLRPRWAGQGIQPEVRHEVGSTWHEAGTLFMGTTPCLGHRPIRPFHQVGNAVCVDQACFRRSGPPIPSSRASASRARRRKRSSPGKGPKASSSCWMKARRRNGRKRSPAGFRPPCPDRERFHSGTARGRGSGRPVHDDPDLLGNFELRLQWTAFLGHSSGAEKPIPASSCARPVRLPFWMTQPSTAARPKSISTPRAMTRPPPLPQPAAADRARCPSLGTEGGCADRPVHGRGDASGRTASGPFAGRPPQRRLRGSTVDLFPRGPDWTGVLLWFSSRSLRQRSTRMGSSVPAATPARTAHPGS